MGLSCLLGSNDCIGDIGETDTCIRVEKRSRL